MVKRLVETSVIFLLSGLAFGQNILPDAPSTTTPKIFWVATGIYAASVIADGETTVHNINQGCIEVGTPWLYGRRPDRARFYAINAGIGAAMVLGTRKLGRSSNPFIRKLAWGTGIALMSYHTQEHFRGAAHNLRLNTALCH